MFRFLMRTEITQNLRFQREARAAARLPQTTIVPLLGASQQGRQITEPFNSSTGRTWIRFLTIPGDSVS